MTFTFEKINSRRFLVWVALFAFITALSRYVFANHTTLFNRAFEQIAWQYLIDDSAESGPSLVTLLPSGTDSGMLALSGFAVLLQVLFHTTGALTIVLSICSALCITLQVYITEKVFGKTIALIFVVWNFLATPILWPLSAAYFGSQILTSVFPFLLLLLFSPSQQSKPVIIHALIVAAFVCFSIQNAALIPAYILTTLLSQVPDKKNRATIFSLIALSTVIIFYTVISRVLHQVVPGPLQFLGIGASLITDYSTILSNFVLVFSEVLPKGIFLYSCDTLFNYLAYWLLFAILLMVAAYYIKEAAKLSTQKLAAGITALVFLFISACNSGITFDVSKFSFFSLRSFAYILPLLFAAIFYALSNSYALGKNLSYILIVLCGYYSFKSIYHFEPIAPQSHKPAAWLLAKSISTKPHVLLRISNRADFSKKNELISGYAWGLTAATLKDVQPGDTIKLKTLKQSLSSFGEGNKSALLEGVNTAFTEGVTPVLDPYFLLPLQEHLTR